MKYYLDVNDNVYIKRYGTSLKERWDSLSQDEQSNALDFFKHLLGTKPENGLNFEKEHLLRIVIGYGGRECLKKLEENALPAMHTVIWEPEYTVFLAGCVSEDIHKYIEDDRFVICIGRSGQSKLEKCLMENVCVTNAFHNKMMAIGDYVAADNKDVAFFKSCYIKAAEEVLGESNSMKSAHSLSCENWLNAINILNSNYVIGQLFEQITTRDIPVIIVAAGPSLAKNCRELKKAKGKAIVVSVTHALKTLYDNAVEPDMVAVTDAAQLDFSDCDKERKSILLSSVYASKHEQNSYNGRVIFFGFKITADLFRAKRTESDPDTSYGTGSVATDVFSLFIASGFRTFILVGQDLAFDEDGFSHSDGLKENSEIIYETEGLYGNIVKTRFDWERTRRFYEKKMQEYDDIQVIDATEGGARIKGTLIMPLKEAIDRYCKAEYPVSEWLMQLEPGNDEEKEYINSWFKECINDCEIFSRHLDNIIEQNKLISSKWKDMDHWDESVAALCKRYDLMYKIIMDGDSGFVLKHYCIKEILNYIENALLTEGDENINKRMLLEYELFILMRNKCNELIKYIEKLRNYKP